MNGQNDVKKEAVRDFDLAIAWNWQYDADFIDALNQACLKKGLKPYLVNPSNFYETLQLLRERRIRFRYFFDRASDSDVRFFELEQLLYEQGCLFINHPERIKWIDDKILLHMEFIINKFPVPTTFIYYPADGYRTVLSKIKQVGIPFVVKPAHKVDEGGQGVLINAHSVEDVYQWHGRYNNFIFLLQKQVMPCIMDKKTAWFRVFYIMGKIIPVWWDPMTHIYDSVTKKQVEKFRLQRLFELTRQIARIYKLGFFSTEIAIEKGRRFFVTDYVNDQCDMRRKSKYPDGICDELFDQVSETIVSRLHKIR
jgi:hypothetical protein